MLILRSSPASPFGRKVKIAAAVLGLQASLSVVDADTTSEADPIRRENPLGKIPTLLLENGTAVYDSRVILEYLDHLAGGGIIPTEPAARFQALTLQALADGIADAALLQVYEGRWRPEEHREPKWLAHQAGKVARGLAALDAAPPSHGANVGTIALACALGYIDLRFGETWRGDHPNLVAWLDRFAATVPAFEATRFKAG